MDKYIKSYIESITNEDNIIINNISENGEYISVQYYIPVYKFWNEISSINIDKKFLKQFIRDKKIKDIL
jgi:hypothetical protein